MEASVVLLKWSRIAADLLEIYLQGVSAFPGMLEQFSHL